MRHIEYCIIEEVVEDLEFYVSNQKTLSLHDVDAFIVNDAILNMCLRNYYRIVITYLSLFGLIGLVNPSWGVVSDLVIPRLISCSFPAVTGAACGSSVSFIFSLVSCFWSFISLVLSIYCLPLFIVSPLNFIILI